ncbi:MAG: histidine--tRNA ligase [Elusimicrobia bacterium]|nr:histidine--tRNA ligase [Elusimicrobiota bacterium]
MAAQSVKGFKDILPPESERTAAFEALSRRVLEAFGFRELRLPTVESQELFVKATGETTDIVEKEMFVLTDAGGRHLALRPEGTPGAVRAFLQHNLNLQGGRTKLYYVGSMFRAERPQAGRFREFEQIGAEAFGNAHPSADVESILALTRILDEAGLKGRTTVHLNNLGCERPECRPAFRSRLLDFLRSTVSDLCDNCKRRVDRNPLRALDCKGDGPRLKEDPKTPRLEPCAECRAHFDTVLTLLPAGGVAPQLDSSLVRGLDYYTRTVFEIRSSAIGSQDALAGGGRYDGLIKSMGGPDVPATGWALGVERVLMALAAAGAQPRPPHPDVYVAVQAESPELEKAAFTAMQLLRGSWRVEGALFGHSLKSQMREADRLGASVAVIFGQSEFSEGKCTVKDLREKDLQSQTTIAELERAVRNRLTP